MADSGSCSLFRLPAANWRMVGPGRCSAAPAFDPATSAWSASTGTAGEGRHQSGAAQLDHRLPLLDCPSVTAHYPAPRPRSPPALAAIRGLPRRELGLLRATTVDWARWVG